MTGSPDGINQSALDGLVKLKTIMSRFIYNPVVKVAERVFVTIDHLVHMEVTRTYSYSCRLPMYMTAYWHHVAMQMTCISGDLLRLKSVLCVNE